MNEKRTHQIGVRVNDAELRRLELRAKLMPGHIPLATYLRLRGLDVEPQPAPDEDLVQALDRIADLLMECRRTVAMAHRGKNTEAFFDPLNEASEALRELVAKVG